MAVGGREQSSQRSVNWQASVARPGEASTQMYRLSDDGALLGLRDMLFGAPRELIAGPALTKLR